MSICFRLSPCHIYLTFSKYRHVWLIFPSDFSSLDQGVFLMLRANVMVLPWMFLWWRPSVSVSGSLFQLHPPLHVCPRRGCPRLPSPQTQSSAGCSIQPSPGRSPALCLENVKMRCLLPPMWLASNGGMLYKHTIRLTTDIVLWWCFIRLWVKNNLQANWN